MKIEIICRVYFKVKGLGVDYSNLIGCDLYGNFNFLGKERNIFVLYEKYCFKINSFN